MEDKQEIESLLTEEKERIKKQNYINRPQNTNKPHNHVQKLP